MKNKRRESKGRSLGVHRCKVESVRKALQTYTDEIVEAELETACDRLEASQSLSPETIETISSMATRIGEGIMAGPKATLENASKPDVGETIADLFELNSKRDFENDWQTRPDDLSIDS